MRESVDFRCRERIVSYVAMHHMAGSEVGVQMDCEHGPRIKRWRQDRQGKRDEDAHPISPQDFEKTWREIAGTGWENLHDCGNGTLEKHDPHRQRAVPPEEIMDRVFRDGVRRLSYDPLSRLALTIQYYCGTRVTETCELHVFCILEDRDGHAYLLIPLACDSAVVTGRNNEPLALTNSIF